VQGSPFENCAGGVSYERGQHDQAQLLRRQIVIVRKFSAQPLQQISKRAQHEKICGKDQQVKQLATMVTWGF
jgi:hypothetical protein